jgi:hypothetical protein
VPAGVVMLIVPVTAPVGTVAVTSVLDFTLNSVAATPPKVTAEVWLRLTPVMVTLVPTGPLAGVKLVICGVTRKGRLSPLPNLRLNLIQKQNMAFRCSVIYCS